MKNYVLLLFAFFSLSLYGENLQKKFLPPPPKDGRFKVSDRDWPENFGDASICLWKNDSIAAFSLTIDDNCAPDHEWWIEMGKKYELQITWFVVTSGVSGKNSFNGTWENFSKLVSIGHDVQSHTLTHLHGDSSNVDIENEYSESKKMIEKNIPGHRVFCLAYPGGKNSNLNNPEIAMKYYIACRGTTGSINPANKINYQNTNSLSGVINFGDAKFESQDLKSCLERGSTRNKDLYRAWYCCHFHLTKPEFRERIEEKLKLLHSKMKSGELWCGLFSEIVKYGQERDTAALKVLEKSEDKIVISLSDEMDDSIFNYPLTIKIRVDSSWKDAKCEQNKMDSVCKILDYNGARYILTNIIPDKGNATIIRKR